MSPFNPDKFRLDSTSQGGVNSSIDRKIEKLSQKCAELIQKNKHKDAKKILSEIKELKALRIPEDETDSTPSESPDAHSADDTILNLETTLATTPLILDQEKTVVSAPPEIQKIPAELDKTVVTMPFDPVLKANTEIVQLPSKAANNRNTIIGISACIALFFTMAVFSFLAFKDFPGKGNYFDWLKAESIFQKAESERKDGNFDQAIANYEEANKIYPELAKAADARGLIQILEDKDKEALSSLEDAAFNNPQNLKYQRDLANALRLNNQEVKALELITKLIDKYPDSQENKALLALIQLQLKQPEADATISEAAPKAENLNLERDYYAGIFYRIKNDYKNSIECFKRANKSDPLNVLVLTELIKAKELANEDALDETTDLTKIAKNWVFAWDKNASQNDKQKKYEEAAASYAKAAQLDSKNSDRYAMAAKAYLKAGNKIEALKFANAGLKIQNTNFDCLEVISKADENANPHIMEDLYQKALSEVPDSASGWSGIAQWQSKQENKSLQTLNSQAKALKLDPKNAANWYQLACYLEMFNNKREAIRAAAEAMSLEPENEKYTDLRMRLLSSD